MQSIQRVWENAQWQKSYKNNAGLILEYKLAIENYEDFNGLELARFRELEVMWAKRKDSSLTDKQILQLSFDVLDGYKNLVTEIGKENFKFYEDGSVEYIVQKNKKYNKEMK